ncbi:MAG: hypothetical protein ABIP94_01825, partial [Planctomycetota bacterium]
AALAAARIVTHRVFKIAVDARALPVPVAEPPPTADAPVIFDVGDGGSGCRFPWALLGERAPTATFIAGGITPDNVPALLWHRPWGIDLSSGVESTPGIKDAVRMCRLFAAIKALPCA